MPAKRESSPPRSSNRRTSSCGFLIGKVLEPRGAMCAISDWLRCGHCLACNAPFRRPGSGEIKPQNAARLKILKIARRNAYRRQLQAATKADLPGVGFEPIPHLRCVTRVASPGRCQTAKNGVGHNCRKRKIEK